jgi:hypothetical protein
MVSIFCTNFSTARNFKSQEKTLKLLPLNQATKRKTGTLPKRKIDKRTLTHSRDATRDLMRQQSRRPQAIYDPWERMRDHEVTKDHFFYIGSRTQCIYDGGIGGKPRQ